MFQSLVTGSASHPLAEGCEYSFQLTDGTTISTAAGLARLRDRVAVFNEDFLERNFRWKDGTANPVFYIGKEQAELVKKLEVTIQDQEAADTKLLAMQKASAVASTAFANHKTEAARSIAEQLSLGRKYVATNLVADYDSSNGAPLVEISSDAVLAVKATIAQSERLDPLVPITASIELKSLVASADAVLSSTLGERVKSSLDGHEDAFPWVKDGKQIHARKKLQTCLFCDGSLTKDRLELLERVIDAKFDHLSSDVDAISVSASDATTTVNGIVSKMPSPNDVVPDLRENYSKYKQELASVSKDVLGLLGVLREEMVSKATRLSEPMAPSKARNEYEVAALQGRFDAAAKAINGILESHNKAGDEFQARKVKALAELKIHLLATGQNAYREFEKAASSANADFLAAESDALALRKQVAQIKADIRKHGPAAESITKLLRGYLGRSDIAVVAVEGAYQLQHGGRLVRGTLSEGERMAIAFCYFLATLEEEDKKLKDLIVVVDDPVSSLDTKALNYSFGLMKATLKSVAQLVVLTHNLNYMNEVKKWLKPKAEQIEGEGEPEAALIFMESIKAGDGLATRFVEMPKHIREYESEYHFLFKLVENFRADPSSVGGMLYVLPNAMRKVADIFLAFKQPGNAGLSSKLEAIAAGGVVPDAGRVRALDRLINVESHADNLDDLVGMSSMTVEETKEAADGLIELMTALDAEHLTRLRRVCR